MLNWLHFSIYTTWSEMQATPWSCGGRFKGWEKKANPKQLQSPLYDLTAERAACVCVSVCVSYTHSVTTKVLWRGEKEWQPWLKMPWVVLVLMFTVETWLFSSFRLALGFVVDPTCNQTGLLSPDFVFAVQNFS